MFSWKKADPPSARRAREQAARAAMGFDYGVDDNGVATDETMPDANVGDDGELGDEDIGDLDLDDPELLAELYGLTGEGPPPMSRARQDLSLPPPREPIQTHSASATKKAHEKSQAPSPLQKQQHQPGLGVVATPAKPVATNSSALASPLAGLGLDTNLPPELEEENEEEEEVELTEEDWNDPLLMAQLKGLGGHEGDIESEIQATRSAKAQAGTSAQKDLTTSPTSPFHPTTLNTHSSKKKAASVSSSLIAIPPNDHPWGDEGDESDMAMSITEDHPRRGTDGHQPTDELDPIEDFKPLPKKKQSTNVRPAQNKEQLLGLLRERELEFKQATLYWKRLGDLQEAKKRMTTLKTVQGWIRLVEAGGYLDLEVYTIPPTPPESVSTPNAAPASSRSEFPLSPITTPGIPAVIATTPSSLTVTQATSPRTGVSKLTDSSGGPPSAVLSPPTTSTAQVTVDMSDAVEQDVRIGATGSVPSGSANIQIRHLLEGDDFQLVVGNGANADEDTYDMLISQLDSQISLCTSIAHHYFKSGDNTAAVKFHKFNKAFKADLASLQSYRNHGKKAPAFHFQNVTFEVETGYNADLGLNDVKIEVIRGWGLGTKEVSGKDVNAFLTIDLGWPADNMPGAGAGKAETSVTDKNTSEPNFGYSKVFAIERTKPFQRFVERRKATIEVWHYRGFLRKSVSLGKVNIPLLPFMNHSEIHEVGVLADANRKPTGGKIEFRLSLQRPLLKPEIVTKEEKWVVIDEFNSGGMGLPTPVPASAAVSSTPRSNTRAATAVPVGGPIAVSRPAAQTTSKPVQQATNTAAGPSVTSGVGKNKAGSSAATKVPAAQASPAAPPRVKVPEPVKTVTPEPAPATDEESPLEKALNELNSVELLVSNLVLEHEISTAQAFILEHEKAAGNSPSVQELVEEQQDRLAQLEIKMKLLVLQVQTGQLTMGDYCAKVNKRIEEDRHLALTLKREGKTAESLRALARSKMMQGEMKEVEEAMAAQGDDDEGEDE